jgi:phospholipid/cholesterol/gamma-HCH transport system substrate-binding protein
VTVARAAAIGGLALVAILAVWLLLLRGPGGHEYTLIFVNAGQLVKGDNVQVGGRAVGTVKSISLTENNQAAVKIVVQEPYAPLRQGTQAVVRLTSLSGIANRYVGLTPGPSTSPKISDGATLGTDKTTTPVDLDQVFNTLDPKTRKSLQGVIHGFATQYTGKGKQAGQSIKYFNPVLSSGRRLVNEVDADEGALTALIVNTSRAVTAIAGRRDDLSALVGNANTTAGAIASENNAFSQALALLPTTLRRGNSTLVNLRSALDDLDPLVNASKPVAPKLTPFFRQLRPLLHDARPTVRDLRLVLNRAGPNNDLVDATLKVPGLEKLTRRAFPDSTGALKASQPVLEFLRPYATELEGWIRDFGEGASNYDANGHYARIQPIFNAFNFNDQPSGAAVLTPNSPSQRMAGLETGIMERCPGGASQPNADHSAPYRDSGGNLDCDPSQSPTGP